MELGFSGPHDRPGEGRPTIPMATPVVGGRVTLPAVFDNTTPATLKVEVGLRSACFVGVEGAPVPGLGSLVHRAEVTLDARRRMTLDRRVRGFLAVADPSCFDVVVVVVGA